MIEVRTTTGVMVINPAQISCVALPQSDGRATIWFGNHDTLYVEDADSIRLLRSLATVTACKGARPLAVNARLLACCKRAVGLLTDDATTWSDHRIDETVRECRRAIADAEKAQVTR